MNNEPLEREPIDRVRARLEALLKANAAPRCGARSKRTGKPCRGAAMPNGRCKLHGGKSTGPRTPEGLARCRRANWKHGYYSRETKAERSRGATIIWKPVAGRTHDLNAPTVPRSDTDHTGSSISPASMPMARSRRASARRGFRVRMRSHRRALKSIGAVKIRRIGRSEWMWRLAAGAE